MDYEYKVGDQVPIINNQPFKYETLYEGSYTIVQTCTNGKLTLSTRMTIYCLVGEPAPMSVTLDILKGKQIWVSDLKNG